MSKKKQKSTYAIDNNWLTGKLAYKRYIFFSSLSTSEDKSLNGLATSAQNSFNSLILQDIDNDEKKKYYHDYIVKYITMLRKLAESEQAQEIKYVESLKKNYNFPINDYYSSSGKFDYINFIAMLNAVQTDLKQLLETVEVNRQNMHTVKNELKQMQNQIIKINDVETTKYDRLTEQYKFAYRSYINNISNSIGHLITPSITARINEKINEIISNMSKNKEFLSYVYNKIPPNVTDILAILQNIAIEYVKNQLKMSLGDITKINTNIDSLQEFIKSSQRILIDALNDSYNNVMTSIKNDVQKILELSIRHQGGASNILLDAPNSLKELLDTLKLSPNNPERKIIEQRFLNLQSALAQGNSKVTVSYIDKKGKQTNRDISIPNEKGNITKMINKIIRDTTNTQEIEANKTEAEKIATQIITEYQKEYMNSSTDIIDILSDKLRLTKLDNSSTAEILSDPTFINFVRNNISDIFIPGKTIQYKNDITFSFSTNKITVNDLYQYLKDPEVSSSMLREADRHAKSRGKLFLQQYQKNAGGETSVAKAAETYLQILQQDYKNKQALLDAVSDAGKESVEQFYKDRLDSSVSVKEYRYYNDELGYHAGSLGGSDRVVKAIPNILKMLELGGITREDGELIITALLNCFDNSVIGTDLLEDIKSLLIGGAAMMLFDDGFANAENFLQKMAEQLQLKDTSQLPTGGSLHLLYLSGIYIPQSYVLFNIVEHLENDVYRDILNQIPTERITKSTNKSTLELRNPISNTDLQEVEKNSDLPTRASKWNYMSEKAQDKVTIHFLFMAGMLDIMEELEKTFQI